MPENTVAKAHRDSSLTSKSKWVTPVIIVLVVGLFIISMVLGAKKTSGGEEGFGPFGDGQSVRVGGHRDHEVARRVHRHEELAAQGMALQQGDPVGQVRGVDAVDGDGRRRVAHAAFQPADAVEPVGAPVVHPADGAQAGLDHLAERSECGGIQRAGGDRDAAHRLFPMAKRFSSVPTIRTKGSRSRR